MENNMDLFQFYDLFKKYGPQGAIGAFTQGYNPMTGYGGKLSDGALKGEEFEQRYRLDNSDSRLQAIGQQHDNAGHDRAMAEQFANSAYKDLDPGPMQMQGIAAMVNNLGQQQPFRNEPMQGFRNLFLALRGK